MDSPHCFILAEFFVSKGYKIYSLSEIEPFNKIHGVNYLFLISNNNKIKLIINKIFYHIIARFPLPIYYFFKFKYLQLEGYFKIIKKNNPDLLHAHSAMENGIIALHSNFRPYLVSSWGTDILISPKKSKYLKKKMHQILFEAIYIHTVAKHITYEIVNDYDIPRNKIGEFQYGISKKALNILNNKSKKHSTFTVISTRSAKEIYDNETLIKAAKILQDKKINVKIKMITGGKLFKKYLYFVKRLELKNIEIIPLVPQAELYNYLLDADVYVSCSLSDGLSICILEAFAAKLYPIVTDIVANRNVITHGINGSLFNTKDANELAEEIISIINQKEKIKKVTIQNRTWVKRYQNLEQNLLQLEKLYIKSIKEK
ncbi:glycosyltransferase family 4 protein [bacterium]|nr:glycosyltransferase family 4 protein [bacterium]